MDNLKALLKAGSTLVKAAWDVSVYEDKQKVWEYKGIRSTLDFQGCTLQSVLNWAKNSVVILLQAKVRRAWKSGGEASAMQVIRLLNGEVMVDEAIKAPVIQAPPTTAKEAAFYTSELSEEEFAKLIADRQKRTA